MKKKFELIDLILFILNIPKYIGMWLGSIVSRLLFIPILIIIIVFTIYCDMEDIEQPEYIKKLINWYFILDNKI